ncbi:MAG: YCF48-related protein [Chloroflexi bacterium]|nr:YCF48-related protein [Chloroflexota bacterium]
MQTSGVTENLTGVAFRDAKNGWVVGDRGTLLKTSDAGATWSKEKALTEQNLTKIILSKDGKLGWATGRSGAILKYLAD